MQKKILVKFVYNFEVKNVISLSVLMSAIFKLELKKPPGEVKTPPPPSNPDRVKSLVAKK